MTSDFQDPDRTGGRTAVEPTVPVDGDLFVESPTGYRAPPSRPGAYWTGLVVLAIGLAVTVLALATRVTSIVQTVLLAVPLALVALGLERVGRGVGRGSLRTVGVFLLLLAVVGPVVLSLSSQDSVVITQPSADIPSGATKALLRASVGGGQIRIGPEAPGLYRAELRGPGQPSDQVTTTSDKTAVVDLRGPVRRGLLARNRGNDWAINLTTALPWAVQVDAGAVTAELDLRQLDLRGVQVDAGVSRLALRLGQPVGRVPIDLRVSSGLIDVHLPRAAACEVRVDGLSLDNFRQEGLVNEGGVWRTGDADRAERYVVNIRTSGGRIRLHRE